MVTATTTITTFPPPPHQPQQGVSDYIIIQRIGELEQHMADLVEENQALEERKINETVKEAVTASVQYAMRAPLHARLKDIPTSDMKEILLQRMLEENYDKGHEDHRMAYEALQTSILRDESEQFDADKFEERKKMKRAFNITGASDSAQDPLPPPPSPTPNPDNQSPGLAAPGSSKTAAKAKNLRNQESLCEIP
ncbi:hypothetical protein Tco_0639817 [Tanacetum coccineum]